MCECNNRVPLPVQSLLLKKIVDVVLIVQIKKES